MSQVDFGQSLQNGVTQVVSFIPHLIGALLIIVLGYLVSKAIGKVVTRALHKVRFDRSLHTSSAGNAISRMIESPSRLVGSIVFWLIYLGFLSFAVSALNLAVLNNVLTGIYNYVPHVIAAIAIFLVASLVSIEAVRLVARVMGRTATAKLISAVIPSITMSLAVFMILNELNIAKDIVNILFTAIVSSLGLGLALAFGLGGRDVAKGILEQAANSAKENSDMMKSDLKRASANAKAEVQSTKQNLQSQI
jgi:hypothetical protein